MEREGPNETLLREDWAGEKEVEHQLLIGAGRHYPVRRIVSYGRLLLDHFHQLVCSRFVTASVGEQTRGRVDIKYIHTFDMISTTNKRGA